MYATFIFSFTELTTAIGVVAPAFSVAHFVKVGTEPGLVRPFAAPVYPWFLAFALGAAVICLGTMAWFNRLVAAVFVASTALPPAQS